jgi:alpha-ketoglutarate-dependent taurine dioxygenase
MGFALGSGSAHPSWSRPVLGANTSGLKQIGSFGRKAVSFSAEELVQVSPLEQGRLLPLLVRPRVPGVNLIEWVRAERSYVDSLLLKHGAILFRGFGIHTLTDFELLMSAVSEELLEYSYQSTPRTNLSKYVYTSTEYHPELTIPQHSEMSYAADWPMKIWFFCMEPSPEGGSTPLADCRRVYERIDPAARARFAEKEILYVRNYGSGLDLSWEKVFQTTDRDAVDAYCRENGVECDWRGDDRLRTQERHQAVARHPRTNEMVWFNQAHLFHVSNVNSEIRENLLDTLSEDELPRNAYLGDGSTIDAADLQSVREAYEQETVSFEWQKSDVLLVDNMLVAHGRTPYRGSRKVVVGMAESFKKALENASA